MHRADRSPTADTALVTSTPCQRVSTGPCGDICQSGEAVSVSKVRHISAGPRLTDEQREAAIERAGVLIYRYMGIWEREGCMAARGDADRARLLMEQLIAGRSREQIAKMERERGLDLPACANDARSA